MFDKVVSHPRSTIVLVALITLIALTRLVDFETYSLRLEIDSTIDGLLPRSGAEIELYNQTRDRFGGDDVLLIAWFTEDLFKPQTLAAWKRLTRRIKRLSGVEHVDSLATAPAIRKGEEYTEVAGFLSQLPEDEAAAARLRDEALANRLYVGQLISTDGKATLMSVHFSRGLSSPALFDTVNQIVAAAHEEAGNIKHYVSGPVFARLALSQALFRDLEVVLPVAVIATLLVAAAGLRSVRGVLLPLIANAIALSWTLAIFVERGHALNLVTVIIPPVIFVVGFAYSMHVVSSFDRELARGLERIAAIRTSLQEVLVPLTLTAFTTAVGFASLAISDIESIRLFGLYTAAGALIAWICALAVVPAGLHFLPARRVALRDTEFFDRLALKLAAFDLTHRRGLILAGALLAICSVLAMTRLELSTDYLRNFPDDSPVTFEFNQIGEVFSGVVPLQIVIESDIRDAFKEPVNLDTVADLQAWLLAQPEIGATLSLVDYVRVLYEAFGPADMTAGSMPNSANLTDQLLLLGAGKDVERFADSRYTSTLINVRASTISTGELAQLVERIERRLDDLPNHLRGYVTGSTVIIAGTIDDITRGQVMSLLGAAAVIYLLLVGLFASFRVGALALLPNLLPILAYFGILGLTGITLNITTSLVASVVLGIAVDDTIHFLSRFNAEARRVADETQGIERALASVIRPVTFTTIALAAGFSALTLGELQNQVEFGALAAAMIVLAWVLDVTFTPALSGKLRFVTLWESLTVDLGCANPHQTIPLFAGLTERQARIAALMGTIESFKSGERVVALGEPGKQIRVVINGELSASIPRGDRDETLRTLTRGDLIGEVGVFHGTATANVDATTDVEVLRLQESCLERIQHRYPRIGAQLFHNLGKVLADRLADVTTRL